jgi:hypothetical protein
MTNVTVSVEVIRAIRVAKAKALKVQVTVTPLTSERREWEGR